MRPSYVAMKYIRTGVAAGLKGSRFLRGYGLRPQARSMHGSNLQNRKEPHPETTCNRYRNVSLHSPRPASRKLRNLFECPERLERLSHEDCAQTGYTTPW